MQAFLGFVVVVVCGVLFGFGFFYKVFCLVFFFFNGGHERQDELVHHPSQLPLSKDTSLKEKRKKPQQNEAA